MKRYFVGIMSVWLCAVLHAVAQAQGQRIGGAGGGGNIGSGRSGTAGVNTRQYFPNGTVGDATISVDPDTRRLIVITDDETSQYVSQVITNLDRPKPQVLIKVVFLEVTYNNNSDVGLEGGWAKGIGQNTSANAANVFGLSGLNGIATNLSANSLGQPLSSFSPAPPGAGLYQVLGQNYQVTLRAIAQAGKTEVLSRPSILTRSSQPATITVGQSVPLVTSVSYSALNGTPIPGITYQSVGIILKVTPFITSDNMVEMIVSPQISNLSDQSVTLSAGVSAPVINIRSADTVVVTPNAQTVIIGGLMQKQKTSTDSKVPILGDIPGLGALFKRKVKATTKTELIIFLTPHIVMDPMQLTGLTTTERNNAVIAPQAFPNPELDRYLDTLPVKPPAALESKPDTKPKTKRN